MLTITLKKISETLGISISTVSRALKNHPDISEKTKTKVKELANALDYEPNVNAVNLRASKNNLFGIIVPTISNFFYDSFISAVEEDCRKSNYALMILQSGDDVQIENDNIKLFRQSRICGLFVCISKDTKTFEPFLKLKALDIPVIFFDKVPDIDNCNKVCVADVSSATIAANAINKKNKQHVLAVFGNTELSITKKRLAAFTSTLNKEIVLNIQHAGSTSEAEEVTSKQLLSKPDTVFCMSDEILVGSLKAIQKADLAIPKDVSVISISNGFIPTLYHPQISYVETSGYKLGKLAFSSMMACMAGSTFVQDLTIESILVDGGSLI